MKPEVIKDLIIFLTKAQRPPKIYVENIFPLELHTFLKVSIKKKFIFLKLIIQLEFIRRV